MADSINFKPIFNYIDENNQKLAGLVESKIENNNQKLITLFESRLLENNEALYERLADGFATKEDSHKISTMLDELLTMVHKLDHERLLSVEWMRRVDDEVEKIKKHLQIV